MRRIIISLSSHNAFILVIHNLCGIHRSHPSIHIINKLRVIHPFFYPCVHPSIHHSSIHMLVAPIKVGYWHRIFHPSFHPIHSFIHSFLHSYLFIILFSRTSWSLIAAEYYHSFMIRHLSPIPIGIEFLHSIPIPFALNVDDNKSKDGSNK